MSTLKITSFEQYKEVYKQSVEEPEKFWASQAKTFHWRKKWNKTLEWDFKKPECQMVCRRKIKHH